MTADPAHAHELETSRKKYRGVMPDAYYHDLGRCETGGRRGDRLHSTRTYTGAFGIHRGTAHRWSGRRDLTKLTYKEQVEIADRIAFLGWTNKRGEYVYPVGPFGWGAVKLGCRHLLKYLCASKKKVVQKYRGRACQLEASHG